MRYRTKLSSQPWSCPWLLLHVDNALAQLWPPLLAKSPDAKGLPGKLTAVVDELGRQVQYNGHFLYTFVEDSAGHVNGQGVQDFFVATPVFTLKAPALSTTHANVPPSSDYWY